jgi:ABC-type multidrug transport system fused ATPase/permease subunit
VAENLRVGNPDASEADIREAIEHAQATDFIERHEGELNAIVGERQRGLAINRALLKNIMGVQPKSASLNPMRPCLLWLISRH